MICSIFFPIFVLTQFINNHVNFLLKMTLKSMVFKPLHNINDKSCKGFGKLILMNFGLKTKGKRRLFI